MMLMTESSFFLTVPSTMNGLLASLTSVYVRSSSLNLGVVKECLRAFSDDYSPGVTDFGVCPPVEINRRRKEWTRADTVFSMLEFFMATVKRHGGFRILRWLDMHRFSDVTMVVREIFKSDCGNKKHEMEFGKLQKHAIVSSLRWRT